MASAELTGFSTISFVERVSEPLTFRERWFGWYGYEFASSAFNSLAMSFLLPLLTVTLAAEWGWNAQLPGIGRPPSCKHVSNTTCISCVMGQGMVLTHGRGNKVSIMELKVPVLGSAWMVRPDLYYFIVASSGIIVTMIFMLCLAPLGDTGKWRKGILYATTVIGGVVCACCFFIDSSELYWLSGILSTIAMSSYSIGRPMYNAYLPMLTDLDPDVDKAHVNDDPGYLQLRSSRQVVLSHNAMGWGSIGAVIVSVIGLGIFEAFKDRGSVTFPLQDASNVMLLVIGFWWIVFGVGSTSNMLSRRVQERIHNQCFVVYSWQSMRTVLQDLRSKYTQAYTFLWVLLSYIGSLEALMYLQVRIGAINCIPHADLVLIQVASQVARVAGAFGCYYIQYYTNISIKGMILSHLTICLFLTVWGTIGNFSDEMTTYSQGWELLLLTILYGFNSGSLDSYHRTVYASMIPRDSESRFFAWYVVVQCLSYLVSLFGLSVIMAYSSMLQLSMLLFSVVIAAGLVLVASLLHINRGMEQSGRRP